MPDRRQSGSRSNAAEDDSSVERPAKRRLTNAASPAHEQRREVGLMRDSLGQTPASFVGSASGIHFVRSVYGAIKDKMSQQQASHDTPQSNIVPGEDDRLAREASNVSTKPLWNVEEVEDETSLTGNTVTLDDFLDWTKSYFDNWHPAFPLLHAPSVLNYFETLSNDGIPETDNRDQFELAIVKSLITITLADHRQSQTRFKKPVPASLVFMSFDAAIESIQTALLRPATIPALQAVVCVQLLLVSMLRHNAASRIGGLVVRLALQLGLHRCPTRFSSFSRDEIQLRRRVFWSIYALDRHICHSLGLPLTIRDDDIDVCYPNQERHMERENEDSKKAPDERLRLLAYLAKHAKIRGSIMELRNKSVLHSEEDADQAVLIQAQISKWWNDIEEYSEYEDPGHKHLSFFHKMTLDILRHESIIALHRPSLTLPKKTPSYSSALQACISASKSIINILHQAIPKHNETTQYGTNSSVSHSPPLIWPSFTWAAWMSAFILIYAAAENQVALKVALKCTDRSLDILEHLASRGSVWPNACAFAIRDLRSALVSRNTGIITGNEAVGGGLKVSNDAENNMSFDPGSNEGQRTTMIPNDGRQDTNNKYSASFRMNQLEQLNTTNANTPMEQYGVQNTAGVSYPGGDSRHVQFLTGQQSQSANWLPSSNDQIGSNLDLLSSQMGQYNHLEDSLPDFTFMYAPIGDANFGANAATDPFHAFDIPFWIGQDQYADFMANVP